MRTAGPLSATVFCGLAAASLFAADPPAAWTPDAAAREWTSIVLHHTATAGGSVAAIDAAHRRRRDAEGRPWRGIGYHFLIGNGNGLADGAVEPTFRWAEQLEGAHAGETDHNRHGIGVALVGDFESSPPTPKQVAAATRLVAHLRRTYGLPRRAVVGHGAFRQTACPGRLLPLDRIAGP